MRRTERGRADSSPRRAVTVPRSHVGGRQLGKSMPPEIISIGSSMYQLRLAPRELPLLSASDSVRRTRLPRIGPRGRLERPSSIAPNRRPFGGPSPSVLIHQSYLARVTSAPVISERLADSYRAAWMAREYGKFEASMRAGLPPKEGASEPEAAEEKEEPLWDPDMLHEHVMGCLQARAAAFRALGRFAQGILPERALSHRHLHPLRAKLRADLSQHLGAIRLATLDLGEALQAWEESAGKPLVLLSTFEPGMEPLSYAHVFALDSQWLLVPLGTDPLLLRWFVELEAHLDCKLAALLLPSAVHSGLEVRRMRTAHEYLTARKFGPLPDSPRAAARALTQLPTSGTAPPPEHGHLQGKTSNSSKLAILMYGTANGYARQQFRLHGAYESRAAERMQAMQRGKLGRARTAAERLRRAEVLLAADTRVSAFSLRKRRIEQRLAEVGAALALPADGHDRRRDERERAVLLARRLELEAQLAELSGMLTLAAAAGIQACFLRFRRINRGRFERAARKERMASRIQAAWRGYMARRGFKLSSAQDEIAMIEAELAWLCKLHEQAALRVQAHVRGMLIRSGRERGAASTV
ncbi:hypothetical protein T492DRAFT_981647 [Pavlovales sp. CCMP2436]|nr:hypothetical protein T492DRAFT_981647 [Pavlovales sp. CCMP2436]